MVKFEQSLAYKNGLTLRMLVLLEYFSSKQALGICFLEKKEIANDNVLISIDKELLESLNNTGYINITIERFTVNFKILPKIRELVSFTEVTLVKNVISSQPEKVEVSDGAKEIFEYYNNLAKQNKLNEAKELTKKRSYRISELIKKHGIERIKEHIDDLSENEFFLDKVGVGWYSIDWIFKEEQIAKSLENKYKTTKKIETEVRQENKVVRI